MKKALWTAIFATTIVLTASANAATFCFEFFFFCDGLEVTVAGGDITGNWVNYDCLGSDTPIYGTANVAGGFGSATIFCGVSNCDECGLPGLDPLEDWALTIPFIFGSPLSPMSQWSNFDQVGCPGNSWVPHERPNVDFVFVPGACNLGDDDASHGSLWDALRNGAGEEGVSPR